MSEKKLVEKIISRDENAFELLYKKYHGLVYYVILQIVQNKEDASELTQDTFLKFYQKIESYRGGNLKYFILQIARNITKNYLERVVNKDKQLKKEYKKEVVKQCDYSIGKIDDLLCEHFKSDIRQIIIYKIVFNFSFQDIAETMSLDVNYVYRSYKASLKTLKLVMGEV